jgi:hypothetical protein
MRLAPFPIFLTLNSPALTTTAANATRYFCAFIGIYFIVSMSTRTMCYQSKRPYHIFFMANSFKVIWITASRCSAKMIPFKVFGNWPLVKLIKNYMNKMHYLRITFAATSHYPTVSIFKTAAAPQPASRNRINCYSSENPLDYVKIKRNHSATPLADLVRAGRMNQSFTGPFIIPQFAII